MSSFSRLLLTWCIHPIRGASDADDRMWWTLSPHQSLRQGHPAEKPSPFINSKLRDAALTLQLQAMITVGRPEDIAMASRIDLSEGVGWTCLMKPDHDSCWDILRRDTPFIAHWLIKWVSMVTDKEVTLKTYLIIASSSPPLPSLPHWYLLPKIKVTLIKMPLHRGFSKTPTFFKDMEMLRKLNTRNVRSRTESNLSKISSSVFHVWHVTAS